MLAPGNGIPNSIPIPSPRSLTIQWVGFQICYFMSFYKPELNHNKLEFFCDMTVEQSRDSNRIRTLGPRSRYPCREAEAIEDMTLIIKTSVSRSEPPP